MKSGVGWHLKGVGREARETAREAARRSGMSVGEWLDTVIIDSALDEGVSPAHVPMPAGEPYQRGNPARQPERHPADEQPRRRRPAESDKRQRPATPERPVTDTGLDDVRDRLDDLTRQIDKLARVHTAPPRAARAPVRDHDGPRDDDFADESRRPRARGEAARPARYEGSRPARDQGSHPVREEGSRQFSAAIADLNERLDQLSLAGDRPRTGLDSHPARDRIAAEPPERPRMPAAPATPLDQAMIEIADRQRALDGYPSAPVAMEAPAPAGPLPRARNQEFQGLEQQLRQINSQIETLNRPCAVDTAVHKAVDTLRDDLAEIGLMVQDAMPRKAVEALELETRKLAERIDETRHVGADAAALSGLERGLDEVRDALRALTPAENLAGLDDAIKGLAYKIDSLALGQQDPAALRQLEGAIVAMRGIVSHVASNDALDTLAEEMRALAAKVEQATSGNDTLSTLERKIETIADALQTRHHGGEGLPREFEAVVNGLTDKIERLSLSRGDDAALGHLEGRIVNLVEKLDASDARLAHLEAIERGLAELLIHIEHNRVPQLARAGDAKQPPARVDALQRDLVSLQHTERKTQDSLEAMQGTLGHVVDRLAMIETDLHGKGEQAVLATAKAMIASAAPASPARKAAPEPKPAAPEAWIAPAAEPDTSFSATTVPDPIEFVVDTPAAKPALPIGGGERRPIDPSLPPDHPLEPGSSGRGRYTASPADRIAASEAALGSTKPPVIADPGGKSNFIAAARRAAQAAASAQAQPGNGAAPKETAPTASIVGKVAGAMRKHARMVIVGISVIVIVLGSLNIVRSWLGGADEPETNAPSKTTSAPTTESEAPAPAAGVEPSTTPSTPPPGRQSSLFPTPPVAPFASSGVIAGITAQAPKAAPEQEVTGTVSAPAPATALPATTLPAAAVSPAPAANGADKLPHTFGATLRAAAAKGDPAAQFEVALRYAEGRGVPQNLTEAADWFERAAKQGLAPAQFRLAGLYEKGFGVKKNTELARRYYTTAGDAGHAKALHNLAVLYAEGVDGKPDYQSAAQWFRKAAARGVSDSQYNLGILYARGIGVEQNLAEAYRWFALAAKNGDQESAKKRDDVAGKLDAQSLQMAKDAVETFTVEPQPESATQVKSPPGGWDGSASAVPIVTAAGKRKPPAVGPRLDLTTPRPAQ
jgi:localization factor PodJL